MNAAARIDVDHLKPVLVRGLTALAAAAVLYLGSAYYLERMNAARTAAEARLAGQKQQFFAMGNARQTFREFLGRYQAMAKQGLVGPGARLEWVDAVKSMAAALAVPELEYELLPTMPLATDYPSLHSAVEVSPMRLNMRLLHEGDLVRLLERLEQTAPAAFWVESCRLERLTEQPHYMPQRGNVRAGCRLLWLSVPPAPGSS